MEWLYWTLNHWQQLVMVWTLLSVLGVAVYVAFFNPR